MEICRMLKESSMEERFVLDNNDNVIDFEDKTDKYCLSQEDVCNLLNKQQQRIAELEQDLEFTTKTANELIEIKHKLEQELAEIKEKAIVPKFSSGQIVYFANIVEGTVNKFNYIGEDKYNYVVEDKTGEVFIRMKERTFATEQEAQTKLKEIQENE